MRKSTEACFCSSKQLHHTHTQTSCAYFFLCIFSHAQEEDRAWGMITFTEVESLVCFPGKSKVRSDEVQIGRAMLFNATGYFWQKGNPSFKVSLILQIGAISWRGAHLPCACREVRVTALPEKAMPPKPREERGEEGVLLHLEGSY